MGAQISAPPYIYLSDLVSHLDGIDPFFIRKSHGDKYFPKTPTSGHDKPDDAICEDDSKQIRIHQHIHSPYYDYYTIYLW